MDNSCILDFITKLRLLPSAKEQDVIYEYGVAAVSEALGKIEKISPFDMSADKIALICAKKEEDAKQTNIKTDRLSEKSKTTLSQYDRLRKVQNQSERKVV